MLSSQWESSPNYPPPNGGVPHEQRTLAPELSDPVQRRAAYRQLQDRYLELQQELRDLRLFLREQRDLYSYVKLDYAADQRFLETRKSHIGRRERI